MPGQGQILFRGIGPHQVFQPALQPAVRVQVVDDPVGHGPKLGVQLEPRQLIVQVVLKRLRPVGHVGHGVVPPLALLLNAVPRRPGALLEVVRPFLVHLQEPLEVLFVAGGLVDHQLPLLVGRGVGRLGLDLLGRQVGILLPHLQDRVLLHLLLDPLFQRQDRQLEDLHRLDHPRSQYLLLNLPEFLTEG